MKIAIIGQGYVGLTISAFAGANYTVIGFDAVPNVATPLTAETVVVPPNVPPEAVTVTEAVECVTVLPVASTRRTTGCVAKAAPEVPPTGCVVIKTAVAGVPDVAAVLNVAVPSPIAFTAFS